MYTCILLELDVAFHMKTLEVFFTEGCFMPSLVEIGQTVLEDEHVKNKVADKRATDDLRIVSCSESSEKIAIPITNYVFCNYKIIIS